jgi:hypothetical protein
MRRLWKTTPKPSSALIGETTRSIPGMAELIRRIEVNSKRP